MNLDPPKTLQGLTSALAPIPGVTNLLCNPTDLLFNVGVQVLQSGVHCGKLKAIKNATVKLMPGEHYFLNGGLDLTENTVLQGDDVALVFDDTSRFKFADSSQINLTGRKSGTFAGFVLATIYIPAATLHITGVGNRVADQSAWTVVIAKSIRMSGSPNLVINANYAGSSVPVPAGVGNNAATQVALVH